MSTVPNMISAKDLSYLSDLFKMHLVASKKCSLYASKVKDEEIKQLFEEIKNTHENYCNKIITLLS